MKSNQAWIIRIADAVYTFDHSSSQLFDSGNNEIALQPMQKKVLQHFMRNPGRAVTFDELAVEVWNNKAMEQTAVGKVVRTTRRVLGDPNGKSSIATVPKEGWRFDGEIIQNPENAVQLTTNNNGSKVLSEVLSIWAFRSPFNDDSMLASLYCEVSFNDGRFSGSDKKERVGFRLALRRAELHILTDSANVLQIKPGPGSVQENRPSVSADVAVSRKSVTSRSAIFCFESLGEDACLKGAMWSDGLDNHLLQIRNTQKDSACEPPEMGIQIRCRREDMIISDVHYTDKADMEAWENASEEKRLAVTQYLREELINVGLEMGSMEDPYAVFILADSITREDYV